MTIKLARVQKKPVIEIRTCRDAIVINRRSASETFYCKQTNKQVNSARASRIDVAETQTSQTAFRSSRIARTYLRETKGAHETATPTINRRGRSRARTTQIDVHAQTKHNVLHSNRERKPLALRLRQSAHTTIDVSRFDADQRPRRKRRTAANGNNDD